MEPHGDCWVFISHSDDNLGKLEENLQHPAWLLSPGFLTDALTPKARLPASADRVLPYLSLRSDLPLQSVPQAYKASPSEVNLQRFKTPARRRPPRLRGSVESWDPWAAMKKLCIHRMTSGCGSNPQEATSALGLFSLVKWGSWMR